MMQQVIIASLNPVKINAVRLAFTEMLPNHSFEFKGVAVDSGVSDQPMSDSECMEGALNRVKNAEMDMPHADFWVGLEGGIDMLDQDMIAFAWMVVKSNNKISKTRTSTFTLPKKIKELVLQGIELGVADDIVFKKSNSKQANGAVGLLTNDLITRDVYYKQALILALIPFVHDELYGEQ